MNNSIRVENYSFGTIEINGRTYTSDLLIVGGIVQASWWRKNGHAVDVVDVPEIFKAKSEYFVIGQGKPGLMKSTPSLRSSLAEAGIILIEEPTAQAVVTFNDLLSQGKNAAAGFHLTC